MADGTDAMTAAFAATNDLLTMGSDSDDMWNTAFGGITGPDINAAFIGFFPEIAYDSMVTIGRESSATPGGAITAVVADPPGAFDNALGGFATSGADLVLTDGTWFTTPDQVNALGTGPDFRVLLGQVTCSGDVEYQLNVQLNDGGVGGAVLQYVWDQNAVDDAQTLECSLQYPADPTCGGPGPVDGCTDPTACNYDATANNDDGSCEFTSCAGCTDATACNYDPTATIDDGSCDLPDGCTDATACNYDATASCDDGSCEFTSCAGCTDATACNYDPTATIDDGSCDLPDGCTDATACNYNASASCDDGSCVFATGCDTCSGETDGTGTVVDNPEVGEACDDGLASTINDTVQADCTCVGIGVVPGCTDANACNYNPAANQDDGSCVLPDGCTDTGACNYDAAASCDDGSCEYTSCAGCTDATACNYDATATIDDGSCDLPDGCTDAGACNYDASASCDDGSCEYVSCAGCTDAAACNYDATATINDGSCDFPGDACDDGDADTINDTYQADCGCAGTPVGGGPATPLALTPLGTCASLTGDVSGGDVSFEIVPATSGVRVEVSTADFDAVVTILDGVGTVVTSINVGGLGDEYLNVGNLTAGDTYEVVVSSASGAGAFNICGQILPDTRADYGVGPYDLCDIYKADYVAADDYRYRFQLDGVDQTSYTNGVANTLLVLNNVPLLDLDTEYNVQIDAGFELSLADGSTELVWVMADEDNAFTTLPQPVTQMRTIDNCANHGPHFLGDYIRATPWVCGSSDWEWSFVRTDITEFEILKLSGSTNRWLRLSSVGGLVPGATYDVKCRPIYPNGTPTTFGPVECMTIVGPAPGEAADGPVVEDVEVLDRIEIEPTAAIYPNPNNGEFMNVNLTGVEGKVTVDIINGMGAMVRSMEMTVAGDNVNEVIALNGIASGVYMVNITVNNTVITERLVVQK